MGIPRPRRPALLENQTASTERIEPPRGEGITRGTYNGTKQRKWGGESGAETDFRLGTLLPIL